MPRWIIKAFPYPLNEFSLLMRTYMTRNRSARPFCHFVNLPNDLVRFREFKVNVRWLMKGYNRSRVSGEIASDRNDEVYPNNSHMVASCKNLKAGETIVAEGFLLFARILYAIIHKVIHFCDDVYVCLVR